MERWSETIRQSYKTFEFNLRTPIDETMGDNQQKIWYGIELLLDIIAE